MLAVGGLCFSPGGFPTHLAVSQVWALLLSIHVMTLSGELPLIYLPLYFLFSPSPFILFIPYCHLFSSLSTSLLVVSIDCDRYGHSHMM
jgi:hypothetical protein